MENNIPEGQQSIDNYEQETNRATVRTRLKNLDSIREQAINDSSQDLHQIADRLSQVEIHGSSEDVDSIENILKMLEHPVEVLQELKVFLEDTLKLQEKLHQKHSQMDSEY